MNIEKINSGMMRGKNFTNCLFFARPANEIVCNVCEIKENFGRLSVNFKESGCRTKIEEIVHNLNCQ